MALRLVTVLLLTIGAAAIASLFCYAAWGLAWWTPIPAPPAGDERLPGRAMAMGLLHAAGILTGFIGLLLVATQAEEAASKRRQAQQDDEERAKQEAFAAQQKARQEAFNAHYEELVDKALRRP